MPYSEASKRATMKYQKENLEQILLRYPKGTKKIIQDHCKLVGESMVSFMLRAATETMERDKKRIAELMKESRK